MTKVEAAQAQAQFSELISRVERDKERIVIEQSGQAVGAIVSYEDLKRLEALEDAREIAEVNRIKAENEPFVSLEEVVQRYNDLHGTEFTIEELKHG